MCEELVEFFAILERSTLNTSERQDMDVEKNNLTLTVEHGRDDDGGNAANISNATPSAAPQSVADNRGESLQTTSPRRPPIWKGQRITVDEFRRRYFFVDNRPPRASVKRWIETGTAEGKILQGYLIDGKYYTTIGAAETFINALRVTARAPMTTPTTIKQIREKRTAQELHKIGFTFM